MFSAEINEEERPNQVAEEREESAANNQEEPAQAGDPIKFTKKKRDHEGGLEGPDPSAGLVDSDETRTHLDHIAELDRGNANRSQDLYVDQSVDPHQSLYNDLFEERRPRHRDQEKQNWKRKVPEPGPSPRQINSGGRGSDRAERQDPTEQPPVGIRFQNQAHRNNHSGCENEQCRP